MLVRVSPLTPSRCNPVALGFKPENPCQTCDTWAEFRILYRIETKVLGSAVRALDLGPTSGKCQCAPQGVQHILDVNPLPLDLSPENRCQTWDPLVEFRVLYRIETKVLGSAVLAIYLGSTSGKCQCALQGIPSNTY